MKRTTQNKKPDLILCADFHLREDQPTCRTDDFWKAQWHKIDFIKQVQIKYNCPVIHAGDLFHHWKPSPYLLSETIQHLSNDFWTVYGQHDLPQHSLELAYKCGINTLKSAGLIEILPECHWGEIPKKHSFIIPHSIYSIKSRKDINGYSILVWHIMTYQGKKPWPDCVDLVATKLLRKYPKYDLIVTGDNHQSFVEEYEGRLLVNPGSITRQTAAQSDHKPCVYLWYAEDYRVEPVYLPIKNDVVSREHIKYKEQRDKRIDAFISRLDKEFKIISKDDIGSFEVNLEQFQQTNQIPKSVMDIVMEAIES